MALAITKVKIAFTTIYFCSEHIRDFSPKLFQSRHLMRKRSVYFRLVDCVIYSE
jgi:hypothetical protein